MLIHNTRMKHAAMSSISVHSLELTRERHPRARRDTANATAATATAQVWQTATHQTNAGHLQHTKARMPPNSRAPGSLLAQHRSLQHHAYGPARGELVDEGDFTIRFRPIAATIANPL